MELKLNVKFNIGDFAILKERNYHGGWDETKVMITGYVIHHCEKSTRVYYTVAEANYKGEYSHEICATGHKKRICAKDLLPIKED